MSNARRLRRKGQRRRRPMPTHSTTGRLDDALIEELSAELGLTAGEVRGSIDYMVAHGILEPIEVDVAGQTIGGYRVLGLFDDLDRVLAEHPV